MNPIKTAMRQFTERCRAERALHPRGHTMRIEDIEVFASDDGENANVWADIGGVPVGVSLPLPASDFNGTLRAWIEAAAVEAGDSADAGYRPGAVRLAVDNTLRAVA
jgi:hypothetical protein